MKKKIQYKVIECIFDTVVHPTAAFYLLVMAVETNVVGGKLFAVFVTHPKSW